MLRIVIIAGESSGDQLGRGLIEALRSKFPNAVFQGITGPQMRGAGCQSWGDYQQLALMGITEVVGHLPRLLRFKRELEGRLRDDPPDVLIGIDAPDFNLRLEHFARSLGIPTVHYVCPSVWAWRAGRTKTIAAASDLVLCLLPFEPDFVARYGVRACFVGHPMADEIVPEAYGPEPRVRFGLTTEPVIALLPGSRAGEVAKLGEVFLQAALRVRDKFPAAQFISPAASPEREGQFASMCADAGLGGDVQIVPGQVREVLAAADAVLVASGTATLETMLMLKPMVVAYRVAALTALFLRLSKIMKIEYFALPNLLAGRELVPEFLQERATARALGDALLQQLNSGEERSLLIDQFRALSSQLRQGASQRAADAITELLSERGKL